MIADSNNPELAAALERIATPPAPRDQPDQPPGKQVITVRMTPELKQRIDARVAKIGLTAKCSLNTFCVEAIMSLLDYWDAEDANGKTST